VDEVDKLLKGDDSIQDKGEKPENKETVSPEVEINGRKYTAADFQAMATDYENLAKEKGRLAGEVGELRKKVAPQDDKKVVKDEQPELTQEQIAAGREELKKVFGVVTEEDLDRREYTKEAEEKLNELSKKYGVDKEAFAKELIDIGVRMNPEKFEKIWIANHTDDYLKWKREAMKKDKVETPYTIRSVKEGLDLPSQPKPRFGETVVSRALELIGATEGANV
jgi:hypothetical protein